MLWMFPHPLLLSARPSAGAADEPPEVLDRGASESGFDPCATLDDLARLLEPTPFLRLGPLAYTLPGRRRVPLKILVPTLHRMHFLATQWTAHGTSPCGRQPLAPLRERIVELCRYDPSLAYARLSHAQLHALTEGCLGLFDGWMRRQAAWATDSASISLRAWSAFPGTSPAMPYMAALRVGVRWAQDPTLSELAHRWSSMRTSAPWSTRHGPPAPRRDQAPDHPARGSRGAGPTALSRASGLGRPCGGPASRGPGGRCGPLASISPSTPAGCWRRSHAPRRRQFPWAHGPHATCLA
ncbi:hypothetical protein PAPYR_9965 [Paratrimastix pyriformis]|uniref:Uncharacterized protein n=1 Tax=Paratrimastix pyriformis TaxID=342808 RepID=A0ABQ8UCL1_9EUKA|nr:hypothetical protein PAPYR_9965 [Paratrimastix pyriformis]